MLFPYSPLQRFVNVWSVCMGSVSKKGICAKFSIIYKKKYRLLQRSGHLMCKNLYFRARLIVLQKWLHHSAACRGSLKWYMICASHITKAWIYINPLFTPKELNLLAILLAWSYYHITAPVLSAPLLSKVFLFMGLSHMSPTMLYLSFRYVSTHSPLVFKQVLLKTSLIMWTALPISVTALIIYWHSQYVTYNALYITTKHVHIVVFPLLAK